MATFIEKRGVGYLGAEFQIPDPVCHYLAILRGGRPGFMQRREFWGFFRYRLGFPRLILAFEVGFLGQFICGVRSLLVMAQALCLRVKAVTLPPSKVPIFVVLFSCLTVSWDRGASDCVFLAGSLASGWGPGPAVCGLFNLSCGVFDLAPDPVFGQRRFQKQPA